MDGSGVYLLPSVECSSCCLGNPRRRLMGPLGFKNQLKAFVSESRRSQQGSTRDLRSCALQQAGLKFRKPVRRDKASQVMGASTPSSREVPC